jgi:hypothetical protein
LAILVAPIAALVAYAGLAYACTATAVFTLTPNSGPVGSVVNADVKTFPSNGYATIRFNGLSGPVIWSGNADAAGNISFAFTVPAGAPEFSFVKIYSGPPASAHDTAQQNFTVTASPPPGSQPAADFDGDGKTDLPVYRPSTGTWFTQNSSGSPAYTASTWGTSGDIPVPANYFGVGTSQNAVFRPSTGTWYIQDPGGSNVIVTWGQNGDIPVPADYEGIGKADLAVYRPSTGTWFIRHADGSYEATTWGVSTDIPVPADYEGSGRANLAVYRSGTWYVLNSARTSYSTSSWGDAGDIPVPSTYEGGAQANYAVFRPGTGEWFVATHAGGYTDTIWGQSGDVPQPGDYNGDGSTDLAIYRPSTGTWYLLPSGGGAYSAAVWGTAGDVPVVLAAATRVAFFPG